MWLISALSFIEPERSGWARCRGSRDGVMVDAVEDNAVLGAGEGREGLMNPPPAPPAPAEEGIVDAMLVSFFTTDPRVSSLARSSCGR